MDDDTNYTVFALKLLEHYGPDFTPDDLLEDGSPGCPCLSPVRRSGSPTATPPRA